MIFLVRTRTISALTWAVNGQRLFSGDEAGLVASSEVDFFQHSTTSRPIVRDSPEAVTWLDYKQRTLLVSSVTSYYLVRGEESTVPSCSSRGWVREG